MKAIGIILAGGNSRKMKELTSKRAMAAMPIAGNYRAIDFSLSNMSHSGIGTVAVVAQYNSRSLNEHLNSSKWWDFGRKNGGLFLLNPTVTAANKEWYRGTADAIAQNIEFLKERHEPYVVIASGDGIYKLDYRKVIKAHNDGDADITVVTKTFPVGTDVSRYGVIATNDEGRIVNWEEKPMASDFNTVNCGVYVIRRRLLISLMEQCLEEDWTDLVRDVLIRQKNVKKIMAYELEGFWANINSVQAYYDVNMEFLKPEVRKMFFREYPPIQTKIDDNAPAKYNPGSKVGNSLVADGAIINGVVQDSILFKKVVVSKNASVKNTIAMADVYVSESAVLEYCIVEGRVHIPEGKVLKGTADKPLIVTENMPM